VPALEFVTESLRLPVEYASSIVSELAGIVIALHESRPGSLIVVDEPEAHLHPENQRVMAQVLVRLAAAGVTVIAPTHSSNIMYEVGNLARASLLSAEDREEFGLEESDRLTPDNIGVYFFRPSEHGVNIEEIPFDPGHGYTEESFIEVAEALGDESYWLDTKLQPASR
jgi:hypothetical protein